MLQMVYMLEARYVANVGRGDTYAIPRTAVKRGYYSKESNFNTKNQFSGRIPVVVLDNCSIHTNVDIERVLEESSCLVRYLPPYSPDFNPIELTFNILKAWMRISAGEFYKLWRLPVVCFIIIIL